MDFRRARLSAPDDPPGGVPLGRLLGHLPAYSYVMNVVPEQGRLEDATQVTAPDGSTVRPLGRIASHGSFAHFRLEAGETSRAVSHRTVQEIWYVVGGAGQMWRRHDGDEDTVDLRPGVWLTIPLGTTFQFRAVGEPLEVVAVTMPPWPVDSTDEATIGHGPWRPTR